MVRDGISGKRRPRIALLSPYGGTNLGDAAIQEAAIQGIRRLLPEAELCGITLNPAETQKRHNIPCFPLTGLRVTFYSETLFAPLVGLRVGFSDKNPKDSKRIGATRPPAPSDKRGLWEAIKAVPVMGSALKMVLKCVRASLILLHELRHLGASLRFVRSMDMVIVAGGGQLDEEWGGPWGHPYALFRWAILSKVVRTRFVVLSVGTGKLRHGLS